MARQDWTYIQISKQMAEALDNFLKTDIAKKYSLSDKNQLVRYLVIRFLEKYQKEYGLLVTNQAMENIKKSVRMQQLQNAVAVLFSFYKNTDSATQGDTKTIS